MTGRRLFHREQWEATIKPKVIDRMKKKYPKGPFTAKHPKWLKVMRKVESRMWLVLPQQQRDDYDKRAEEISKGDQTKEAKAEYMRSP